MKLLKLYKALLAAASMEATKDGYISYKMGDATKPTTIKGKRLVLPTPEHLADPVWDDRIVFHPLSENVLRGESTVLEEFRSALNVKLHYTMGLLSYQLLIIATSVADHSKLSPDQSEFLSKVKNADEKTLEVFQKLLKAMPVDQRTNTFVSIYLKRGGSIAGKRHSRVGVVSFPFYNELKKGDGDVFGVKLRVKDRETFINLLEYVFPQIGTPEAYNRGSDSDVAPYLDALMKATMAVAGPINDQITLFGNIIDGAEEMLIEDKWVPAFDNLAAMVPEIRKIPMQAGNEGASSKAEEARQASAAAATHEVIEKAKDFTSVAAKPALPAQLLTPTPTPAPWMAPVNTPTYGPTYAGATAVPKTARGGLDFDALMRTNPALGGGHPGMGYVPPAANTPRYQPGGWNPQQQYGGWNQQQFPYGGNPGGRGVI